MPEHKCGVVFVSFHIFYNEESALLKCHLRKPTKQNLKEIYL